VDFTGTPTIGCPSTVVNFTDNSILNVAGAGSYSWNFGDGNSINQQNPSHTYGTTGMYMVTLTVTNSQGCVNSLQKPQYINIVKPVADFSVSSICKVSDSV